MIFPAKCDQDDYIKDYDDGQDVWYAWDKRG
jgi:hypothetical protein